MATIREVFRLVENFTQSQEKIMNDCVNNTSETILDANRDQLFAGKDKQGKEIIPEYTPTTISIKKEKGQPTDRVTLKDTGEWHRSLFMKTESNKIPLKFGKSTKKFTLLSATIARSPTSIVELPETKFIL